MLKVNSNQIRIEIADLQENMTYYIIIFNYDCVIKYNK